LGEGYCLRDWEKTKTYNIVYFVNGVQQTNLAPSTYATTQSEQIAALPTAVDCGTGKSFAGWCPEDDAACANVNPEFSFTVKKNTKGVKKFIAKCN